MKKSTIILIHIVFWAIILTNRLIIARITVLYLNPTEYGEINLITNCLLPLFFYIGYLIIMKFQEKRKYVYFSLLGMVFIYLTAFVISKKIFGMMLIPVPSFFL